MIIKYVTAIILSEKVWKVGQQANIPESRMNKEVTVLGCAGKTLSFKFLLNHQDNCLAVMSKDRKNGVMLESKKATKK